MGLRITQVDAFSDKPFSGNPAAVCVLPEPASELWMQNVAMEMNLAETAFLLRQEDGFQLRWFTPLVEVDLCGHATLASAHTLWEEGHLKPDQEARFHTRSGLLTARRAGAWIEMNFPSEPPVIVQPPPELNGLNTSWKAVAMNRLDYLVELESEEEVRNLKPDLVALRVLQSRGVMVTSRSSSPGYDFISRFFAPGVGIDEDPVTGSAHCCLGPYWQKKLNKKEMIGYQASRRGGTVKVRVEDDRVHLGGQACTVLKGELTATPR